MTRGNVLSTPAPVDAEREMGGTNGSYTKLTRPTKRKEKGWGGEAKEKQNKQRQKAKGEGAETKKESERTVPYTHPTPPTNSLA